ncbi:MAG: hypothetical protein ABI430_02785 [Candidatus Taylorbacteria bacterium]
MKKTEVPEKADGHHCAPRQYIVTQTLAEQIDAFANIGLKIPEPDFIQNIENRLVSALKEIFSRNDDVEIIVIPAREQSREITTTVNRVRKKFHQPLVLSTCPLLSFGADGRSIHLSRIVDIDGNIIGIGPRPRHKLPSQQIADLNPEIADRDVILVEDGAFTGSTLLYSLRLLLEKRARVQAIVLGIMFPEAEKSIRQVYQGEIHYCLKPANPLDWMPSHDFFPFIPNAGRVVGYQLGKIIMPVYLNFASASIAMPYVKPYGKPEWASLPCDHHALNAFSYICLHSAEDIFRRMKDLRGEAIHVGDIIGSNPATYIPVSHGGYFGFPLEDDKVEHLIELDRENQS